MKKQILNKILNIIDERIGSARAAIESATQSRNNETKSSAGDKHETSRALIQAEIDNNTVQLNSALKLRSVVNNINLKKNYDIVEPGALVHTDDSAYFISVGLGRMDVKGSEIIAIGAGSPLGQKLLGKSVGTQIQLNTKRFQITEIL